jgi:hypothetical protein
MTLLFRLRKALCKAGFQNAKIQGLNAETVVSAFNPFHFLHSFYRAKTCPEVESLPGLHEWIERVMEAHRCCHYFDTVMLIFSVFPTLSSLFWLTSKTLC